MKLLTVLVLVANMCSDSMYCWGDVEHFDEYRCEEPECMP
jgi:hypothetical protein